MSDTLIVIVIIAAAVIGGAIYIIRHMQGKGGGCCASASSSSTDQAKKLTQPVVAKKIITIEGMHCNHCKNAVESAIAHIDGAIAHVDLEKKQACVELERSVSNEVLQSAITDAGFTVVSIEDINISNEMI